jgi:hypothetical protein
MYMTKHMAGRLRKGRTVIANTARRITYLLPSIIGQASTAPLGRQKGSGCRPDRAQ